MFKKTLASIALLAAAALQAAPVSGQGSWESTLYARDIDADGTADAYYDAEHGLTWWANADPLNGVLNYSTNIGGSASRGAGEHYTFTLYQETGITGWRLPTGSELVSLLTITLGNAPGATVLNSGPFSGVRSGAYWQGAYAVEVFDVPTVALAIYESPSMADHYAPTRARPWAVRTGDLAPGFGPVAAPYAPPVAPLVLPPPVPEPAAWAMLLTGVACLAAYRRRKS